MLSGQKVKLQNVLCLGYWGNWNTLSSWHYPAIDVINDVIEHPQYKNRQYNILRSVIHVTKNKKGRREEGMEGGKQDNMQAAIGTEGGEGEKN